MGDDIGRFRIVSFEGREPLYANSADQLITILRPLSEQFRDDPTLVNLYDGDDRIAIVGVGGPMSVVQALDKGLGINSMTSSGLPDGDDLEFNYQGQATYISPEH